MNFMDYRRCTYKKRHRQTVVPLMDPLDDWPAFACTFVCCGTACASILVVTVVHMSNILEVYILRSQYLTKIHHKIILNKKQSKRKEKNMSSLARHFDRLSRFSTKTRSTKMYADCDAYHIVCACLRET